MELKNKVALVTGAALGFKEGGPSIGSAIAIKFAEHGVKIVVVDINEEMGQKTVDTIKQNGGDALFLKTDVSNTDEVKATIKTTEVNFGRLDCLVNCAASYEGKIFNNVVETPEEDWIKIFDINFHGYYRFAKYAIPLILKSGGGTIINISSSAAFKVTSNFAVYPCTKAAINSLTRTLAVDFSPQIRSNAICPGFVRIANSEGNRNSEDITKWIDDIARKYPLRRVCSVEEIANVALFLASDTSSYINGQCIRVDGGYSISDTHDF